MIFANPEEVREVARLVLRGDEFIGPRPGGSFPNPEAFEGREWIADSIAYAIEREVSTPPWINRKHNGTGRVYHTDRHCQYLKRMADPREAGEVEMEWYDECGWCDGSAGVGKRIGDASPAGGADD